MPSSDEALRQPTVAAADREGAGTVQPTMISSDSFPSLVDPGATSIEELSFDERYDVGGELGKGGMGEVRVCRDVRLGRTIALQTARAPPGDAHALQRFLREARVQGQLEHPAIVPV